MALTRTLVVMCDYCGNVVGSDSAMSYEECDMCGCENLVEEEYYGCTNCGDKFISNYVFDVCPVCGEPA